MHCFYLILSAILSNHVSIFCFNSIATKCKYNRPEACAAVTWDVIVHREEHIAQCTEKRYTQSAPSASIAIFVITFATYNGSSFHDVSIEICDLESRLCINQCTIKMHLFCELHLFHMDVLCVFFFSLALKWFCVCFFVLFNWFLWNVRSQMTVTNFEINSKNQVKRMCNVCEKQLLKINAYLRSLCEYWHCSIFI